MRIRNQVATLGGAAFALAVVTGGVGGVRGARAAEPPPAEPATADEANARPARPLGLRDALAVAVRQNPTLANETIDVAISEAEIAATYGVDDYVVDGSANWISRRTDPVSGQPFQQTALDDFKLHAGITKPFADGGRLGVALNTDYTRVTSHFDFGAMGSGDQESSVYAPGLAVTFFQPLLRGFGDDTVHAQRRIARAQRDVQDLEREGAAANMVRDVVQAYWELVYAAQELEIKKSSLALAGEQLRIIQAGIDVGKLAPTEALSVEQAIATREEEVLLAEQMVSERSLELRRLVGLEIGPGEIDLAATDRLEVQETVPDLDTALRQAMERNPQLVTLRAQGKTALLEVEVNENGLLPQLDFNASAGPSGNSDSAGSAVAQLVTFDSWQVQAGVTFSMSLENRGARGNVEAANARVRKVKLTEADVSSQIAVQVVRAVNLVRSAGKRIAVSAKASKLAEKNVDLERARWEVGRSTNFEILKRQEELAESQLREARARTDYLKAISVLESLTGDLLPHYGIDLSPRAR